MSIRSGSIDSDALLEEANSRKVAPYFRIVPNGATDLGNGKIQIKASLLATPVSKEDGPITLANWPCEIGELLASASTVGFKSPENTVKFQARVLPKGAKGNINLSNCSAFPVNLVSIKAARLLKDNTELNGIWQRSFARSNDPKVWENLAKKLDASLSGSTTQPGAIADDGTSVAAMSDKNFGDKGQLIPSQDGSSDTGATRIDSVLAAPYADLAIGLEAQRSEELISSLKRAVGSKNYVLPGEVAGPVVTDLQTGQDLKAEEIPDAWDLRRGLPPFASDPNTWKIWQFLTIAKKIEVLGRFTRAPDDTSDADYSKHYRISLCKKIVVFKNILAPSLTQSDRQLIAGMDTSDSLNPAITRRLPEAVYRAQTASPTPQQVTERAVPAFEKLITAAGKASLAEAQRRQKIDRHHGLSSVDSAIEEQRQSAMNVFKNMTKAVGGGSTPSFCDFTALNAGNAAQKNEREKALRKAQEIAEYGAWAEHGDANTSPPLTAPLGRPPEQIYFAIESDPGLSRAFGFAFDITLEMNASDLVNAEFMLFSARAMAAHEVQATPWTLTKARRADGMLHMWPATLGEVVLRAKTPEDAKIQAHCISQFEGVILMGSSASGGPSRFDLTSMDVRAAAESERNRRAAYKDDAGRNQTDGDQEKVAAIRLAENYGFGTDFQTTGLTLMNRSVQIDTVRNLAARLAKAEDTLIAQCNLELGTNKANLLDADDLTSGFRLAVGMPNKEWATRWKPMMARRSSFGGSGQYGDVVDELLDNLIGAEGSAERIALTSSLQANPGRMLPSEAIDPDNPEPKSGREILMEQTVAVWDGGPMGVDCSVTEEESRQIEDAMIFGRMLDVPDEQNAPELRLRRLRYGRPYRFAMVAVFAGGQSVPLGRDLPDDTAGPLHPSEADIIDSLYYPPARLTKELPNGRPFFRALRQDAIGAPTVLIPEAQALKQYGAMGFQHSNKLVVRSLRPEDLIKASARDLARTRPAVVQRVIVMPSVSQSQAVRHIDESMRQGLFDGVASKQLNGGLSYVHYETGSGFPKVRTKTRKGVNGEAHIDARSLVLKPSTAQSNRGEEIAHSVFKRRSGRKRTDYFPDPAAEYLTIAVRRKAGTQAPDRRWEYLDGSAVNIDLSVGNVLTYPDRRAVLLSLRRTPKISERDFDIDGTPIFLKDLGSTTVSTDAQGDVAGTGFINAHEVEAVLLPGEQIDVDMWAVPSVWCLAHDFAVVQGLATHLSQSAEPNKPCSLAAIQNALIENDLPAALSNQIATELGGCKPGITYVGPGGVLVPDTGVLMAIAEALHKVMKKRPLPEISGIQTVTLAHAVNRPAQAPRAEGLVPDVDPFSTGLLPRPDRAKHSQMTPLRALRPTQKEGSTENLDEQGATPSAPLTVAANGSRSCVLTGTVEVDLERVDALEIVAQMSNPGTSVFDDPTRGRSLARRRAGTWPKALTGAGDTLQKASVLFGFQLGRDGQTTLPTGEVTLLRIEGLPYPAADVPDLVELLPFFEGTAKASDGIVSHRHAFPDGKARVMRVNINVLPRTAGEMTTTARVAKATDPWLKKSSKKDDLVYLKEELIPRQPLPRDLIGKYLKDAVEVVLPATVRPSPPDAKAPVPVFLNSNLSAQRRSVLQRDTRIRIPLGRAWFSSGDDERLGIVVWPPHQLMEDHDWLAQNVVALRDGKPDDGVQTSSGPALWPKGPNYDRLAEIIDFTDEDLGPGGKYVTRRGSDPVRVDEVPSRTDDTQVFLSQQDFPDLLVQEGELNAAQFVGSVAMPLGALENGKESEINEPVVPPMMVSLITYRPLFDPVREEWYVDVHLRPGPSADPFVRLGLVRYQPHTTAELRCSRPVVQWVQPMPERKAWLKRNGAGDVILSVAGPASQGRAPELSRMGKKSEFALEQQRIESEIPQMRVTAFTEGRDADGRALRETIDLSEADQPREDMIIAASDGRGAAGPSVVMIGTVKEGLGDWSLTILAGDLASHENVKFLIEEVDVFLPATFETEPLSVEQFTSSDHSVWRATGPRFSVVLE